MVTEKSKKQLRDEIERARRFFYAQGRRVSYLLPQESESEEANPAKPRKQRLKMFA